MNKRVLLSALLLPLCSHADETDIERVTVTGDFRQVTLDQLSSSASIINADRLTSRRAEHLDDMLNVAPNVNFATGASRGRFIQIRGIGERSQFAEPINPSVSFLVDNFDFSGLAAAGVIFDTQQVEVFRGPQSTLFGTGALAGAVKISGAAMDAPAYVTLKAGSEATYRIEGAYGAEITDGLSMRLAGVHNESDGFGKNVFLDRPTNTIDENGLHGALSTQLGDSTTLTVDYRWYDIDNGYDAFTLDNSRFTLSDEPGFDRQQTDALSVRSDTRFSAGQLTMIGTYADHDIGYGYDEDWTYTGFHPDGYTSFDAYFRDVTTKTAEIRFTGNENSRLFGHTTWLAGAFYKNTEEDLLREYTYADGDFTSVYSPETRAIYGQTNTALSSTLSLVAGLRFEEYAFDYADNAGLDKHHSESLIGGKLALEYSLNEHFIYASVSRGFKGAGINPDGDISEENRFYGAEFNRNYELGVKGPLFTPALTMRGAVFYMEREDTQISDYLLKSRDDGTPEFVDFINNADVGTNRGIEVEFNWQASDNWQVAGSLGILDAYFADYVTPEGTPVSEQRQAQAPRKTANLYSELVLNEHWVWHAGLDYKSEYRFSDGHDVMSPSTTLVNTDITWYAGNWSVSVWVNNLFDRIAYTRGFGGFSNDPRDGYANPQPYYQLGDGRQQGVEVRYQF